MRFFSVFDNQREGGLEGWEEGRGERRRRIEEKEGGVEKSGQEERERKR